MRPPVDCAIWSTPFQTSDNAATVFAKYTLNSPLPPLLLCSFLYPVHWRHQTEIVVVLILAQGSDYLVQRVFNTIEHIFTIEHILAIFNLKRQLSTGKLKKAPICWRCCSMNSVRIENLWRFSKLCPIVSKLCPSQTFANFIQFSPSSALRLSHQLFNITNNQICNYVYKFTNLQIWFLLYISANVVDGEKYTRAYKLVFFFRNVSNNFEELVRKLRSRRRRKLDKVRKSLARTQFGHNRASFGESSYITSILALLNLFVNFPKTNRLAYRTV